MITGLGNHSSAGKDHLGNGSGMVRPFGLSRERCHVPMDPQNLGYLSFSPSFASCVLLVGEIGRKDKGAVNVQISSKP